MMSGELGQPPGGWPEAIQRKVLKGAEPITVRPGSLLRRRRPRRRAQDGGGAHRPPADDRELASYLMYPKVFSDFAAAQETYGPTEVLPTPAYFYGLPRARRSRSSWRGARPWSSAARRSASPTRTARCASSSS